MDKASFEESNILILKDQSPGLREICFVFLVLLDSFLPISHVTLISCLEHGNLHASVQQYAGVSFTFH